MFDENCREMLGKTIKIIILTRKWMEICPRRKKQEQRMLMFFIQHNWQKSFRKPTRPSPAWCGTFHSIFAASTLWTAIWPSWSGTARPAWYPVAPTWFIWWWKLAIAWPAPGWTIILRPTECSQTLAKNIWRKTRWSPTRFSSSWRATRPRPTVWATPVISWPNTRQCRRNWLGRFAMWWTRRWPRLR